MGRFLLTLLLCVHALASIPPQTEGYSALYNLDHDKALTHFEREVSLNPSSADAWNQLAHALLHRRLYLSGAMERSIPGTAPQAQSKRVKAAMPAAEEKRFLEAAHNAARLSDEALKKDPRDERALYSAGVAHAHLAQYHYTVHHAYVEALKASNRSDHYHRTLLAVNPAHPDALLIPGMHDYIAGSVPLYLRWIASIAGLKGEKARGLLMVERAVKQGRRTAVESRVMLAILYHRERRYSEASALITELSAAFPGNLVYRRQAEALARRTAAPAQGADR